MKCYLCAKEGKSTDAVGICIICGMGLCMEHAVREDIAMWEGGYPFPERKMNRTMPRILCPECNAAVKR